MGFYYSKELFGIKKFYNEMRKISVDIGTFEFRYNNVESDVILNTLNDWQLVFLKRGVGEVLVISLLKGFRFTIDSNEKYAEFIKYFEISGVKGTFSLDSFKESLNNSIPEEYLITDNKRRIIYSYDCLDKESEGIYPIGVINWTVLHAKNPELASDKYHRRNENLLKTKQLYPEIYKAIKDMDISIKYGVEPGEKTDRLCNGIIEFEDNK